MRWRRPVSACDRCRSSPPTAGCRARSRELPYVERGDPDGVPVVLLDAWLDSRRCFDQLMAALPERIRAFAFDQRGHGDATKPAEGYRLRDFADDIGAFMDAVRLHAAVLAGASSGGYVAQRFAIDDRDRILGLALLGSPFSLRGPRPPLRRGRRGARGPDRRGVRPRAQRWDGRMRGSRGDHGSALPGEPQGAGARWRDAFEGLLAAEPPLDTGPISAPTLIAWGARDSLLPRADQEAMAAQIPGAPHQHFARSRLPTRWWAPMRSRFARASTNRGEPPPLVIRAPRCPPFDSRA